MAAVTTITTPSLRLSRSGAEHGPTLVTYSRKRKHDLMSASGPVFLPKSDVHETPEPDVNKPLDAGVDEPQEVGRADPTTAPAQPSAVLLQQKKTLEKRSKKKMVQMTIDLGGSHSQRKRCIDCGMEYVPWDSADAKIHVKFHSRYMGGVRISPEVKKQMRVINQVKRLRKLESGFDIDAGGDCIVEVSRRDEACVRATAARALELAEKELGAISIPHEALWKQCSEPLGGRTFERFKFYLCVRRDKVIGVCLVETIFKAFRVLPRQDVHSSSVTRAEEATEDTGLIGISRLWVSSEARGAGIATCMLDTACDSFLYGIKIERGKAAFSQPTESGARLARKWFKSDAGWLVYDDGVGPA